MKGRLRTASLIFLGWTLYAITIANIHYVFGISIHLPNESFWRLVRYELPEAWLWALLTGPIIGLARRFPIVRGRLIRRIALHIGFAVVIHFVRIVVMWIIQPYVRGGMGPEMPYALVGTILLDGFIYAAIVAVVHAIAAEAAAHEVRNLLLEAELSALRMQLQPHFLFNTLHSISELARYDPARTESALSRLGDLLRWTLESTALKEVPLRDELQALQTYLDIQRLRYGEAMEFHLEADPDTLDLCIPILLLQPLVENSIRHGLNGAGVVHIRTWRSGPSLHLAVSDDGRGLPPVVAEGMGLRTTRARLCKLYGAAQSLDMRPGPLGGAEVTIRIPARESLTPAAV